MTDPSQERRNLVRQFLAQTFLLTDDQFPHADDESLMTAGVLDSTGVLELILFLESTFAVTVDDTEATPRHLDTVQRIVDFLAAKLDADSPSHAARR